MSLHSVLLAIGCDLQRAKDHFKKPGLAIIALSPGFQAVAVYRLCRWFNSHINARWFIWWPFLVLEAIWIRITEIITGIHINLDAEIGPGLLLVHFGGIVIGEQVIIGSNCDIHQGVTLGYGGSGAKGGYPKVGNRVYIAAGAKIIGNIQVGNDVIIGANAVVTKSVPDRAIVGGVPARMISSKGSFEFIKYRGMENDPERQLSLQQLESSNNT